MREPETNGSIAAMSMSVDRIQERLSNIKDNIQERILKGYPGMPTNIEEAVALEAAISMISILEDEGINDAEALKDLIFDYNLAVKQNRENHRKYETAAKAVKRDGVWHCPECNHRVAPRHSFCHWCGKKLGGW